MTARAENDSGMPGTEFTVTAPGRVNLLGEHTDYNGLPVLPMAIEPHIRICGTVREDRHVRVRSADTDEWIDIPLESPIPKHPQGHWVNYVKAGLSGLLENPDEPDRHELRGCDLLVSGTIPQGVGLSSSSALVVASALALLGANGRTFDRLALAERMAAAEHYVGTRGGGMDQAACLCGEPGSLLKIDFFPLHVEPIALPESVAVVICDSTVRARKTENALQAYNLRAVECRFAGMLLRAHLQRQGQVADCERLGDLFGPPWNLTYDGLTQLVREALRDEYRYREIVELLGDEERVAEILTDYSFADTSGYNAMLFACGKRYRHIVSDGLRVERSREALRAGDVRTFGELMNEGQRSARDDFEISCPELNQLTEAARDAGALGARLTGAGFGGCTVNLVRTAEMEAFCGRMRDSFYAQMTHQPDDGAERIFVSAPGIGAAVRQA